MNILTNILISSILLSLTFISANSLSTWKKNHFHFNKQIKNQSQKYLNYFKNSQKGQLTSIGLLVCFILSIIFVIQLYFFLKYFYASKFRVNTYLCAKYNILSVNKVISNIGQLNRVIASAKAISLDPRLKPAADATIKISKLAQEKERILFIKKFYKENFCQFQNFINWNNSFPYALKKQMLLERNTLELAQPKETRWEYNAQSHPPHISKEFSFILKIQYSIFHPLETKTYYQFQELPNAIEALLF